MKFDRSLFVKTAETQVLEDGTLLVYVDEETLESTGRVLIISKTSNGGALFYADGFVDGYKAEVKDAKPEIICCKDCEWCEEHYDTDGNAPYWVCKNWVGGTDADGFCHEAERRTDE